MDLIKISKDDNVKLVNKIIDLSNRYEEEIINNRRRIHENPELSFCEYETSKFVEEELKKLGLEVYSGIAETGVVGLLQGKSEGKVLLLRADMDALPLDEETDIEFKSKNKGVMHACGHDVHTVNLLGVAKIMCELKNEFHGTIKFVFQPAEEKGGGGREMVRLGVLQNPKVDAAIALHVMPIEEGRILISDKNVSAYSDSFILQVKGKKAHTSRPQDGVDAINIAANIVVTLNSILVKNLDPFEIATFSIGKISGGSAVNIVPDYVSIKGMIRSVGKEARNVLKDKIESISKDIAKVYEGECVFEFNPGYPSIYNNEILTHQIRENFKKNYSELIKDIDSNIYNEGDLKRYIISDGKPMLGAEDFGFYAQKVPACFYRVGVGNYAPAHSSKFFVDEKYIKLCTRTMALAAIKYLNSEL